MASQLIITCEHGGNRVPTPYRGLFRGHQQTLASHRGYDQGALTLARAFARTYSAPLIHSTITRLLVDLNRSRGHQQVFSEFTKQLSVLEQDRILTEYYEPYRQQVEGLVEQLVKRAHRVVHLSVHSFTPELHGVQRTADVGLLYDPRRTTERRFCENWRRQLSRLAFPLGIRRNYPYLGRADGLTTALRQRFGNAHYAGIELEINQLWPHSSQSKWRWCCQQLVASLPPLA